MAGVAAAPEFALAHDTKFWLKVVAQYCRVRREFVLRR